MAEQITFSQLQQSLRLDSALPFYFIYGEEGYFIDEAVNKITAMMPDEDRDFDLHVVYGLETDPATVIDICRRYPMMASRQLVIVKETQVTSQNYLNALLPYIAQPSETTVLVVVWRGEDLDPKKNKFLKEVLAPGIKGAVMASKRLRGQNVATAIRNVVTANGLNIEDKALAMLEQFVGNDLARIYNEIAKMTLAMPRGSMVTPESIESHIGVSKDYNIYEFKSAIARRDAEGVFTIINHFRRDPKNNPVPPVISTLFSLFSDVLIAIYTPDKSERGLMAALKVRYAIQIQDTLQGLRNYRPWQVIQIIDAIRRADAMSKGIGSRRDMYDILHELVFKILTCPGKSPV